MINIEEFNEVLRTKKLSIVCAESITAGLLSSTIAGVSGASDILKGSIVTYSCELKTGILKVNPKTIDEKTAESIETTIEMVYGLIQLFPSASIHVAVTGVASKPKEEDKYKTIKDQGQIYVVIHYNNEINTIDTIIEFSTSNQEENEVRNEIRRETVDLILKEILKFIDEIDEKLKNKTDHQKLE